LIILSDVLLNSRHERGRDHLKAKCVVSVFNIYHRSNEISVEIEREEEQADEKTRPPLMLDSGKR
jgi:hypothetical protein